MPFDFDTFRTRLKDITSYHGTWHPEARVDYQFYALKQWDASDIARLAEEQRPALTFDRTRTIIDSVSGSEITNRFEPKYLPRNVSLASSDSSLSEMMSEVYRWTRQQSRAEHWQSLAFKDSVTCGIGCLEKFMAYDENPRGRLMTKRVPIFEMGWDPSAQDTNLLDARYVIRGRWMTFDEFKEMFPEKAEEFDSVRAGGSNKAFDQSSTVIRETTPAWMYKGNEYFDERTKKVLVWEYQWFERVEEVCLFTGADEHQWLSKDDFRLVQEQHAQAAMTASMMPPEMGAIGPEMGGAPPPLDFELLPHKKYFRAFVAGGMLLDEEESPVEDFTYKFVTCFRDESEEGRTYWFGLMRPMRDPQKYANKVFSQAAHIFASNPKGSIVYESGTFANPGKAAKDWAMPNALIEVNPGRMDSYKREEPARMPPGLEFLFQVAVQGVSTSVGVSESYFVGTADDLKRTASSAVTSVQQRTLTTLSTPFDALRLYIKEDGTLTLKFVRKYMPDGQVIRITGEDGKPELLPFTKAWASHEYDIIVEDAPASKSAQEEFNTALFQNGFAQAMMESGTPLPPSVADTMPISTVAKTEWRESLALNKEVAKANSELQLLTIQSQIMMLQQQLMAAQQGLPMGQPQQGAAQAPPQ